MKITLPTSSLKSAATSAAKAADTRAAWPILSHLFCDLAGGSLSVTGFNMEVGIKATIPASDREQGRWTMPAKLVCDLLSTISEEHVQLAIDGENIVLSAGSSEYKLLGLNPDDWQPYHIAEDAATWTMDADTLRESITRTAFAASTDKSRAILTGVLFTANEGGALTFAATDTHRLAVVTHDGEYPAVCGIVPSEALGALSNLLANGGEVTCSMSSSATLFRVGSRELYTRLIDGKYPDYQRVIPKERNITWTIYRDELASCLKRCAIIARENASRVVFSAAGDTLALTAESADTGSAHEELSIKAEGGDVKTAFNVAFLTQFLSAVDCEAFTAYLSGELAPMMIEVGNCKYVVMPMQIM